MALKPKEQSLVKQKRKIHAGAQLWSAELSSLLRRLFRDSDGIGMVFGDPIGRYRHFREREREII